jgi:ATP-dependent Clp protease ATP-binding subunit ClpC
MTEDSLQNLTTGAQRIVLDAKQKQQQAKHPFLGINHWMLTLIERHAPMLQTMVVDFDPIVFKQTLMNKLANGDLGIPLDEMKVSQEALVKAKERNKLQGTEKDIAVVILTLAGFSLSDNAVNVETQSQSQTNHQASGNDAKSKIPTLDQFGHDLTKAASEAKIAPVIGREDEIQLVIETLCRRTKRNPVLVGPAGVGKTAIVEGLAQKIVDGKVPSILSNTRIIALQPSSLIAGANIAGELEKRIQSIIREAMQDNIILFIDEIHSIVGAGGMMGTADMASILKPSLARGEIAVIAATTDDEYRRFIETDTALERRFQPIRVHELSLDETLVILSSLRDILYKRNPVEISDDILKWLVNFGQQYMRNRHFPDKAVDLLEQCFAHALAKQITKLNLSDAEVVAQRMIGMPLELNQRLVNLKNQLYERGLLTDEELQILLNRLQVTMRGLDLRSSNPNAIILLSQEAALRSTPLAETIAQALFGSQDRVITIDFARMTHPADISLFVGSPPGYVGYSESLPIHRLIQTPWCVLELQNIDQCYPSIREVLSQALLSGWIMDGRGKAIYFSDSVVILTSEIDIQIHRSIGFQHEDEGIGGQEIFKSIVEAVGEDIASQVDLFVTGIGSSGGVTLKWLQENLLAGLVEKYARQGLTLSWDPTMLNWLTQQQEGLFSERDWERWVDQSLSPALIPYLPQSDQTQMKSVNVCINESRIEIKQI